ncbi:hypothetical protein [Streptomyces sp. NPDC018031]|uniref:hypothetical protein n=1 Tax=Streptomyces sp. NPDC018031 TaxID=3365033 RepID=UPI0037B1B098
MRGLTKATPSRTALSRTALISGGAVAALAAAGGLALVGCGAGSEGVRKEGKAETQQVATSAPDSYSNSTNDASPSAKPKSETGPRPAKVNPVQLVKSDPKVNAGLKANLKPCTDDGDEYPVDVAYGALTGKSSTDVVVTVMNCKDGAGIGSYVYRKSGDRYENVFTDERGPLFAGIDGKGRLTVTQLVYTSSDTVWPSGEDLIVFEWSPAKEKFTEASRTRTDYSETTGDEPGEAPDDEPAVSPDEQPAAGADPDADVDAGPDDEQAVGTQPAALRPVAGATEEG